MPIMLVHRINPQTQSGSCLWPTTNKPRPHWWIPFGCRYVRRNWEQIWTCSAKIWTCRSNEKVNSFWIFFTLSFSTGHELIAEGRHATSSGWKYFLLFYFFVISEVETVLNEILALFCHIPIKNLQKVTL